MARIAAGPAPHHPYLPLKLPEDLCTFQPQPGSYLAFLGRISREKGVADAIDIALGCEMPLKIAGNPALLAEDYFEEIKPRFDHPLVAYVGELNGTEKQLQLLSNAAALFPIQWDEPFGLVLIEAAACGTPVIAYPRGPVPEIVTHGRNGLIVHSVNEAVAAVQALPQLSRRECRRVFEERFTLRRMVQGYLHLYQQLIEQAASKPSLV